MAINQDGLPSELSRLPRTNESTISQSASFKPMTRISQRWGAQMENFIEANYASRSISSQARIRAYCQAFLKCVKERVIDNAVIHEFISQLLNRNPTQAARALAYPRAFLRDLVESNRLDRHILRIVRVPIIDPALKEPITPREYQALRTTVTDPDYNWLFVLAWNTGLSLADCCLLSPTDIDFDHMVIRRKREKMKLRRGGNATIPFERGSELDLMLRLQFPHLKLESSGFINASLAEDYYKKRAQHRIRGFFKRAGLAQAKSFRCFRIALATSLHAADSNLLDTMRILGHTNPATTQRYIPEDLQGMRTAMLDIGRGRSSNCGQEKPHLIVQSDS